jgi:hypothetical protein
MPISEVKRLFGFSTMEWIIIAMGCLGMAALWFCFPEKWWKIYCVGFGLGFLFESVAAPLFTYHQQLAQRHCIKKTDINFLFPFAWLCIIGLSSVLAEKIIKTPLFPAYIIAVFLIGNTCEFIFYKLQFWIYNYREPMFGNFKPFVPVITICEIPIQVIIGYCNIGIVTYFLVHILI